MLNITDQVCYYQELLNDIKTFATRPPWVQLVFMLLMVSIFVVGVVGNLLTCIVIYCDKSMHTATNYYLFNLAISDLIMAFGILLEANVFSNYIDKFEGYDDTACRVHLFLIVALWNNSILIMTTLAVERYIAIWHPLLLDRRPVWSRVMRIMYVIWMIAIIEALPVMWTVRLIKNRTTTVCFILPTTFAKILNVILGLVTFIIPLGIMTFVYTMVALKVNITQRNCSRDKVFNHKNISRRVNKLVTLTLSFLVCWLPFFMLRVLIFTTDWCQATWFAKNWDLLLMICSCNSWFSIVVNPLLFSLMSTKFRKALKGLWKKKIRKHVTIARRPNAIV